MDTLIDNRNFPPEMQQKPQKSPRENKTSPMSSVLVLLGLILVGFLVYTFFLKPPKQTLTPKEQAKNVLIIQKQTPEITNQERDKKIEAFFN